MKDKIEYILFKTFSYLFKICGLKLSRRFSLVLAFVFFYIIPIRKNTTIENISKAFPEFGKKKIKKIAFGSYKSFSKTIIEILYLPWMSNDEIINSIQIKGLDITREKYEEKNGLIMLSAHFGNWEFMAISIALQMGIPFSVVVKSQRNEYVTNWLNNVREKWGNKIVPLGISIRQIYKELKEKNIVAMVADQRGPSDGIRVNFFGRKASVYSGPAILALKTKAPIVYGISVRQSDDSYKTDLEEIELNNLPDNEDEKIVEINQRLTDYLEKYIRQNPEQWLWMHKRWKY
ncbi:MAG: lysophospholipid acyltransferase family protein [Bacteroidetes bacterium]|nr:lysophospholipid acyltransferase family protein [Bacteroidota bacterium]